MLKRCWSKNDEICVRPYPGPGSPVRISSTPGIDPVWAADGRELYYRDPGRMMAVPITTGDRFEFGTPIPLFDTPYAFTEVPSYDVAADGRFLIFELTGVSERPSPIHVVLNWSSLLESPAARR